MKFFTQGVRRLWGHGFSLKIIIQLFELVYALKEFYCSSRLGHGTFYYFESEE